MAEECSGSLKAVRAKVARRSHPYSRPDPHCPSEVEDPEPPRPMESEAVRDPDSQTPESSSQSEVEAVSDSQSEVEAVSDSDSYLALFEAPRPPNSRPAPDFSSMEVEVVHQFDIRRHSVLVDGYPVAASIEQLCLMDELKSIKARYTALKSNERKLQDDLLNLASQMSFTEDAIIQSKRIANLSSLLPRFVKEIEQADSYFDFKQAARAKHKNKIESEHMGLSQIARTFLDDFDLLSTHNMHNLQESEADIRRAAFAIHSELGYPKVDDPVLREPIFNLVLQVREQDTWIDREPEFVIEKIMESNPSLYDKLFFSGELVEDSTSRGAHVKAVSGAQCTTSAKISWSSQNGPSKESYLKKKFTELRDEVAKARMEETELNDELNKLLAEKNRVENAIYKLKRRATLSSAVPKFVEKIERANCYFDYIEAAKAKYKQQIEAEAMLPYQICRTFLKDTKLKSEFNKIDETDIRRAAFAICSELDDDNNHQLDKNGYVEIKDLSLQEPLYKLVFETRVQAKFMDKNPEVELAKIMESNPTLYDACFINGRPGKHLATYEEALKKYSEFWSRYVQVARDQL